MTSSDFVRLQRTMCFGTCPSYTVTVYGDGNVEYTGDRYVKVTGTMYTKIDRTRAEDLFAEAEHIGFFRMDSDYSVKKLPNGLTEAVTDLPSQIVTVSRAGSTKRVHDYYGSPEELRAFERRIDSAADIGRWVGR